MIDRAISDAGASESIKDHEKFMIKIEIVSVFVYLKIGTLMCLSCICF